MPGGVALFKLPAALLGLSSLVKRQPIGSRESALDLETAHPYETRDTEPDLGTVLSENGNITTYYNLIKTYPDILLQLPSYAGVTIVAPSDDAFKKYQDWNSNNQTVVTSILQYHILQSTIPMSGIPEGPSTFAPTLLTNQAYTNVTGGQNVIINNQGGDTIVFTSGGGSRSTLLYGDIPFSGGLLQIVDTLFVPPPRLEPTARDDYTDLTAFLAALYAANLIPVFASSPNVTIFAPRTAAFQQLAGTLEGLSQAELARILSYHLVPGQVIPSSHLTNNTNLTTAAPGGEKVHIIRSGNNMYVDAAQIVQPDILIANGVVHMIDNVLNPDSAATPTPSLATQPPVFPLTGPTKTGTSVPTPFTSALPCTSDCPVTTSSANATATTTTTTGGVLRGTSHGAAAGARCTVLAGLGVGWGAAVVGFLGIV